MIIIVNKTLNKSDRPSRYSYAFSCSQFTIHVRHPLPTTNLWWARARCYVTAGEPRARATGADELRGVHTAYDVVRRRTTRLMHTNNNIATEDDLYDVVLASSSYLYTFGKFSCRRNRQTRPRRFWVHDVLRRRDDLGEYPRLVQELRLDSDRLNQINGFLN